MPRLAATFGLGFAVVGVLLQLIAAAAIAVAALGAWLQLAIGGYLRERWFSPSFKTALDLKCALAFTIECNERSIR